MRGHTSAKVAERFQIGTFMLDEHGHFRMGIHIADVAVSYPGIL